MHLPNRPRSVRWWLAVLLLGASGCADGPFVAYNPYYRHQWREDQKYGQTFHQQREEIRQLGAEAGRYSEPEQARLCQELVKLIREDPNPLLRQTAVTALAAFEHPDAESGLQIGLADADPAVRAAACRAWAARGGDRALTRLAEALGSDTDQDVRLAAARELARFSDPVAVRALGAALEDDDPALQYRAVQSLKKASGRDFGDDVGAWRQFVAGQEPPPRPSLVQRLRQLF